jgi:hypothetical protein
MRCSLKYRIGSSLAAVGLAAAAPACAHHSTAMYDRTGLKSVSGTVKAFLWQNPHVVLDFVADAKDDPARRTWSVEASSPGVMMRAGWSKRILNPGDKVVVEIFPLRNGLAGGEMRRVALANGQVLVWSFRAGEKVGLE